MPTREELEASSAAWVKPALSIPVLIYAVTLLFSAAQWWNVVAAIALLTAALALLIVGIREIRASIRRYRAEVAEARDGLPDQPSS